MEHAVDPAVDASGSEQQQQPVDDAALETMKQEESHAAAVDESTAEADGGAGDDGTEADAVPAEDIGMVDMPSAMDTLSADNQMAFEQDQQTSAEPFVVDETGPSDIA